MSVKQTTTHKESDCMAVSLIGAGKNELAKAADHMGRTKSGIDFFHFNDGSRLDETGSGVRLAWDGYGVHVATRV